MVSVDEGDVDEYLKYVIDNNEDFVDYCIEQGYVTESDVQSDEE